jgi:ankyrin repeat protein
VEEDLEVRMTEERKDDRSYIAYIIIVAAVIAGILGYGYYEREKKIDAFFERVRADDVASVKALLNKEPGLVNARERESQRTPLFFVPSKEMVDLLIASGADVNAKNKNKETLLHHCAIFSEESLAKVLIDRGADINAKDISGRTPLHWAAITGSHKVANLLLTNGADANTRDSRGYTPLHYALGKDNQTASNVGILKTTADLLRKHGAKE